MRRAFTARRPDARDGERECERERERERVDLLVGTNVKA